MTALYTTLRNQLEKTVVAGRERAEKAAAAALVALAVKEDEPFAALSDDDRKLRVQLRAERRRLGSFDDLVAECAYEQWHRMLFARFLAENGLLMHPEGVAVTLADCAELAQAEGDSDAWATAARYAALMLPGIFRNDDPVLRVRFAADDRVPLEKLLTDLPPEVFTADDSLGWVYQFWQSRRKEEVNKSGKKIGGADISAVTQLFTEQYMVQFLLHNTLGAWWVARHGDEPLPTELSYLRLREEDAAGQSTPAAGTFPAWPHRAADLKVLDPSGGSGHFLVAAFALLRRFRMIEEGLSEAEAGDAVLRDNLFGLELDLRCTQIAAFNLALAAWKAGGYRVLPVPNIACSGLTVGDRLHDWTSLAGDDGNLQNTLRRLFHLFKDAPDLGSLIDPERTTAEGALFAQDWSEVGPLLEKALAKERGQSDPAAAIFGATAKGVLRAAELLTGKYHLVVTNVPYLGLKKQGRVLTEFCERSHAAAKADLATVFVERCLNFCAPGGSTALVTPQNWLFLGSYKTLREKLLREQTWNVVARLGPGAFETIGGEVVNVALFVLTRSTADAAHELAGLDASAPRVPAEKAGVLREGVLHIVSQAAQLRNPDARVVLEEHEGVSLLEQYAMCFAGILNGDSPKFQRMFWEILDRKDLWVFQQSTVVENHYYGGREQLILFDEAGGHLREDAKIRRDRLHDSDRRGNQAWGKGGVAVSQMRSFPVTLYTGEKFDSNVAVIYPKDQSLVPAIWAFCQSPDFHTAVRRIDQKLNVTNATLVKVPFDLERWQKVADELYPNGLPAPHSDDPTQWLFDGHPSHSTEPLQVAVARLLGYRWPQQEDDALDAHADADGIVSLPPVAGEPPAAERLRALLAAAFGPEWSPAVQERLLSTAGCAGKGLDEWLRDGCFAQHCRLFHNRPFLWHLWDGRKDGFSVLVNYHKLDRARLDKLIYTYLGNWITMQREADKNGVAGANARLVAAIALQDKLKAIAEGSPPLDIYVRWKKLHEQPIGWEPDLNDGVRLNIRPWVTAGVLRAKFTIKWGIDRGTNPDGSQRDNDQHLTRAEKEESRGNEMPRH